MEFTGMVDLFHCLNTANMHANMGKKQKPSANIPCLVEGENFKLECDSHREEWYTRGECADWVQGLWMLEIAGRRRLACRSCWVGEGMILRSADGRRQA